MASPPTINFDSNKRKKTPSTICSSLLKTVFLHDWWLIKAEADSKGRRLGIGGFASRERQAIRTFCSAAIAKRHDTVTLETADGITITLCGSINRSITLENGFPSEVCSHFLCGFPYYWEEFAAQCFIEQPVNRAFPSGFSSLHGVNMSSDDGAECSPPISLDDLPVSSVRDLLMSNLGDNGNCALTKSILNDILQNYGGNAFKHDMQSKSSGQTKDFVFDGTPLHRSKTTGKQRSGIQPVTGDSRHDLNPTNCNKTKSEKKSRNEDVLCATYSGIEKDQRIVPESEMGADVKIFGKGVTTRSMSRLSNLKSKQGTSSSPNTSATCRDGEPFSASVASSNQFGGMVHRNAASVSHVAILSDTEMEAKESPGVSTVRRSYRPKSLVDPFSTSDASKSRFGGVVTRRNGPDVCLSSVSSREEKKDGKQSPDNPAVRRSNRLRNIKHTISQ